MAIAKARAWVMILSTAVRRTTAAKNPRTVCGCQPVEVIIVAMVTPPGRLSSLSTRACFEPAQASLLRSWRFPHARSSNANNLCARILLVSRKSVRPFKGIFCDDVSEIAVDTVITVNGSF